MNSCWRFAPRHRFPELMLLAVSCYCHRKRTIFLLQASNDWCCCSVNKINTLSWSSKVGFKHWHLLIEGLRNNTGSLAILGFKLTTFRSVGQLQARHIKSVCIKMYSLLWQSFASMISIFNTGCIFVITFPFLVLENWHIFKMNLMPYEQWPTLL